MYATSEFRKGLKIEYNDKAWVIVDFQHVNPGKGSAFVRTRLRNLETAQVLEITFKSGDKVPRADVATKEMQYLYKEGDHYVFMDNQTFDQVQLSEGEVGEAMNFLIENNDATMTFYRGKAVAVDIPNFVELEVIETQPNIKGDTSGGGGKPAKMQTGLTISVPFHINEGDILKVDTRTATYVEKVGKK